MILRLYVHIRVCITVQRNRILSELTWHFTSFASIRVPLSFVPVSLKLERDFHSRSLPNEGIFQGTERSRERSLHSVFFFFSSFFVSIPASCCSVGVEDSNVQETGGPGSGGGAGGGVAVIPDRPPLELDKLPPYHDVAPSPGTYRCKHIVVVSPVPYLFRKYSATTWVELNY